MAKHQAIKDEKWEQYNKFDKTHLKNSQFELNDLGDKETVDHFNNIHEDGPAESEINALLEDVWIDFKTPTKEGAKEMARLKDEVNDKLLQYLR